MALAPAPAHLHDLYQQRNMMLRKPFTAPRTSRAPSAAHAPSPCSRRILRCRAFQGSSTGKEQRQATELPGSSDGEAIRQEVAPLFTPCKLGSRFELSHRMVYPPLTRCRAHEDHVPTPIMVEYYSQRAAKGGLMIAEATYISAQGAGYPNTPGLYTQEQVDAWKPVVAAVHDKGSVFFVQIWHCGRYSHPRLTGGLEPVAPSTIPVSTDPGQQIYVGHGQMAPYPTPKALGKQGIRDIVEEHCLAARNARAAGFDGVEIHAASGYLLDQFLKSANQRTDEYGGSIENRCRLVLEVVEAVGQEIGPDRVGIRLSPFSWRLNNSTDTPYATFVYLLEQLNRHKLAYVHMVEARANDGNDPLELEAPGSLAPFRKVWSGTFITAGGYTAETGADAVASGHTDLVSYGRLWLANPDLPRRFKRGLPLNRHKRDTFYTPGAEGYTDYAFYQSDVC